MCVSKYESLAVMEFINSVVKLQELFKLHFAVQS